MPSMSANDTYTVERSTTVRADADRVYRHIVDFHRWPTWSPWEDVDPDLQRSYSGPAEGVGSVYEWSGNRKAGAGRMEITDAEPSSRVVIDLRFLKPFKSESAITFTLARQGDGTRVTWTMTGTRTLGLRLMGVFTSMDKLVGGDFEKGLSRLRTVAESNAA
jgi:uncharacterized protein YndB with AHSA1/START domain